MPTDLFCGVNLIRRRAWQLIAYGSTLWCRAGLALCSTFWAVGLLLPGETMSRPVYKYMALVGGPRADDVWAVLFGIHAAGMWWRTFATAPRPGMAMAVNLLGVIIFCFAAYSIFAALTYPFPAAIAADLGCAIAAILVAVRTHVNPERGWKSD